LESVKNKEIAMKILIAESDCRIVEILETVIKTSQPDWDLSFTTSGKECIDVLENGNLPDVIILGMELSDMSGFELIGKVRDYSDVPIVFLSDDNDIQILVNAFDTGANDFVVMPFNKAIFIARIKARARRRDWDIQAIERKLANVND
jgi:DNA-binding response OmpR family regulator